MTAIKQTWSDCIGEILEVASFVATPLGAILAVSVAAAAFFYGGGFSQIDERLANVAG